MVNETDLKNELNKCKKRFKGVENFIRRVAFNLGNTPSQTEVKIISCIPIDVTDLQQKIVQLERQLEDARNKSAKEETSSIATAKGVKENGVDNKRKNTKEDANKPDEPVTDESDKMEDDTKGDTKNKLKNGSKGENGKDKSKKELKGEAKDKSRKNSKAEVKDKSKKESKADVKDKSKKESKADVKDKSKKESKADVKDKSKKESKADVKDKSKKESKADVKDKSKEDSKNVSPKKDSKAEVKDKMKNNSKCKDSKCKESNARNTSVHTALCGQRFSRLRAITDSNDSEPIDSYTSRFTGTSSLQYDSTASSMFPTTSAIPNNCRYILRGDSKLSGSGEHWSPKTIKRLFCKKKKLRKNKTHFVYYAQTSHSPFNSYEMSSESVSRNHEVFDCNFLSEIIKKQYKPIPVVDHLSDRSKFTSPVCRDEYLNPDVSTYESDVCSCFRGMFYDVDKYLSDNSVVQTQLKVNYGDIYNDSSLYDVIPVKEKSFAYYDDSSNNNNSEDIEMKCWPEHIRVKPRPQPLIVNYHTISRGPESNAYTKIRRNTEQNRQRYKFNKKQFKEEQTSMTPTNNYSADLINMYTKVTVPKTKITQTSAIIEPDNITFLKIPSNNIQPQNVITNITQESKAEATLGQIKNILKTVLTEVRDNAMKNVEEKPKKDVNLQKGTSRSFIQEGSSLLNSFTYSPFNMNPQQATCSKQMASNLCCHQGLPPMQNYPLIIQTPGRHICSNCFRNSHYKPPRQNNSPLPPIKTEKTKEQRYTETDKLIREIYKSVALDIPTKDTSGSEYNLDTFNTEKDVKIVARTEIKKTEHVISEIYVNRNINTDTSQSNAVSTTVQESSVANSKLSTINSNNTQTDFPREDKNIQLSMDSHSETAVEPKTVRIKLENKKESSAHETEESSSDTDSGRTVVPDKKVKEKKKAGLFSKMMNMFNKKKTDTIKAESDDESSDSDDSQTVCSLKAEKSKRHHKHVIQITKKPHSKITRPKRLKKPVEKMKHRPYMEQEYRRHWNEKLMFQNEKIRHSSEQPFWWETTKKARPEPVYRQNIEARNILVEPILNSRPVGSYNGFPRYTNPDLFGYRQPHPHAGCFGFHNHETTPHPFRNINVTQPPPNRDLPQSNIPEKNVKVASKKDWEKYKKGLAWLKKHNLGVRCGEQWKRFILDS